jgi:hypothetical protein
VKVPPTGWRLPGIRVCIGKWCTFRTDVYDSQEANTTCNMAIICFDKDVELACSTGMAVSHRGQLDGSQTLSQPALDSCEAPNAAVTG